MATTRKVSMSQLKSAMIRSNMATIRKASMFQPKSAMTRLIMVTTRKGSMVRHLLATKRLIMAITRKASTDQPQSAAKAKRGMIISFLFFLFNQKAILLVPVLLEQLQFLHFFQLSFLLVPELVYSPEIDQSRFQQQFYSPPFLPSLFQHWNKS